MVSFYNKSFLTVFSFMALHPVNSVYADNSQMCVCLWNSPLVSGLIVPMAHSTYSLWWLVGILYLTCPKLSPFFPLGKTSLLQVLPNHVIDHSIPLAIGRLTVSSRCWFSESYWLYFVSYTVPISSCPILKKHPDSENFLPSLSSVPQYKPQFPITWILPVSSYLSSLLCPYPP